MNFATAVTNNINEQTIRTENGMKSFETSNSKVLDLFGNIGSGRGCDMSPQFTSALAENEELTLRTLLWARDVRGGAGERAQFRNLLATLENFNPRLAGKLLPKIPIIGRWDDVFAYSETENRKAALSFYASALLARDGLAFKWAPREKSARQKDALELMAALEMTPKQYRKFLSRGTNVVESKMCARKWSEIDFSHVPSLASARYQKAFERNAKASYDAYIRGLESGETSVNAGAVYPYDVVKSINHGGNVAVADAQWKALPNFVGDAKILPMVDVSGSMCASAGSNLSCMDVAISLGLYLSEKNTSEFKDIFLTFSTTPKFQKLSGTLSQRISSMSRSNWSMSTNLHSAFDTLLKTAVDGKVAPQDMPEILLVLSDMQFDHCTNWDDNAQEMIRRKYEAAGYETPKIVFWNLRVTLDTPVKMDDNGIAHVSGFSPAIMKSVLSNDLESFSPYNIMLDAIMNSRYDLN